MHTGDIAPAVCDHCDELKRSAEILQREFENDMAWLSEIEQTVGIEAWKMLKRMTDAARLEYELARTELEQHVAAVHPVVN